MKKFLVIQTAFIGDAILATSVLEKLHQHYPTGAIDILVRKGNEQLFDGHPFLNKVHVWDKRQRKYWNLLALLADVRKENYDLVVNLHRFLTSGFLSVFSGGKRIVGFDKNPLSVLFTERFPHRFGDLQNPIHEVERYQLLIEKETDDQALKHKLYPPQKAIALAGLGKNYITISPGTEWFTKRWPAEKWLAFMDRVGERCQIVLLGGKGEYSLCEWLKKKSVHSNVINAAGKFTLLQSAGLMQGAKMNFANDSAPLHLASAVNAPVTGVFCSTVRSFGFVPLSDNAEIVETDHVLPCRPCGLHGRRSCPQGHFLCSDISVEKLLARIA